MAVSNHGKNYHCSYYCVMEKRVCTMKHLIQLISGRRQHPCMCMKNWWIHLNEVKGFSVQRVAVLS